MPPKYVQRCGPEAAHLRNADQLIEEFARVDPGSDGFRYPMARDGRPSLPGVPDLVNLARLSESLAALANFIDAARVTLLREADLGAEAAHTSTKERR